MKRRRFLAATAAGVTASAAGCVEAFESAADTTYGREPALIEPRPEGIYWPTHTEGMAMAGMGTTGDGRRVSLMYTYPHRFWRVFRNDDGEGYEARIFEVEADDAVHLMANVWDADTGVVVPVSSVDIAVTGGNNVDERETIYPMLSQRMGFHYGDNYHLDGDGGYTARVTVGSATTERFGEFADRLDQPETVEIDFEYTEVGRNELEFTEYEAAGEAGAVEPMSMGGMSMDGMSMEMMPQGTVGDQPGMPMGEGIADGVRYRASLLDAERFGTEPYLAVTAATEYNEFVVPNIGLSVSTGGDSGGNAGDGEDGDGGGNGEAGTGFTGTLSAGLDPEIGFHYGTPAPGLDGSESVEIDVTTPPQVARHEGYETAFMTTPTLTLS